MFSFRRTSDRLAFFRVSGTRRRRCVPALPQLVGERLEQRVLPVVTLSVFEQYLLELVNRSRNDPAAEAQLAGVDLNQGISGTPISTDPKPPLAPNQILVDVAGSHSQDMIDRDFFNHTNPDNVTFSQRVTNAGYPWNLVGENIAQQGTTAATFDQEQFVRDIHRGLIVSPGHRRNIMDADFVEIGTGVRFGVFTDGSDFNSILGTEVFARRAGSPFITGVVFDDQDGDQFFSVGEEVSSGSITVTPTGGGTPIVDQPGPSGGYSIRVPAGDYTVMYSDGTTTLQTSVTVGAINEKIDFNLNAAPQPLAVALPTTVSLEALIDNDELVVRRAGGAELVRTPRAGVTVLQLTAEDNGPVMLTVLAGGSAFDVPIDFSGGDGNDVVDAALSTAAATLNGGGGNDLLIGGSAADRLHGDGGNDTLQGGDGGDALLGFQGNDRLVGGNDDDVLLGSSGRDTLEGQGGNDVLRGQGNGGDVLSGGPGSDFMDGGGNDVLVEEFDADLVLNASTLTIDAAVETALGFNRAILTGGESANRIDARDFPGAVTIDGRGGDDSLTGGPQADVITAGDGFDIVLGLGGNDSIDGGAGNDILFGHAGRDEIDGGPGADRLKGQGASGDLLTGGPGRDTMDGGIGNDRIVEDFPQSQVITLIVGELNVDGETDSLIDIEQASLNGGENGVDIDTRSFPGGVTLLGGAGTDTLRSGVSNDILLGLAGDDFLFSGAGNDHLLGASGRDRLFGEAGNDSLRGQGTSGDILNGGAGADTLNGGGGRDRIERDDDDTIVNDPSDVIVDVMQGLGGP